ncbi:MAG: hypothetical protein MJZ29_02515 [Bacteroidaceae bacterium]|nr:hypothetical protein [Bacteroidaceae bacterium]
MTRFFTLLVTFIMFANISLFASTRVYGVRVYDDKSGTQCKIVSFDVANPGNVKVEYDLGDENVRAAACRNGKMYLMCAAEYTCDAMKAIDLATGEVSTIATYDLYIDQATSLILTDMTYDKTTDQFYALGLDVLENTPEGDYTLGLYAINPETGVATFLGGQKTISIQTIAAANDGNLYGIDSEGNLWDINKRNGRLGDIIDETGIIPFSMQSATFNEKTGDMYWTSFDKNATSTLIRFYFTDEYVGHESMGTIGNHSEIIGLYADPYAASTTAPAAPTDFNVAPASMGIKAATLTWINPTVDNDDAPIKGNISIQIYRNDKLIATLADLEPGSEGEYLDNNVEEGVVTYRLVPVSAQGEGRAAVSVPTYVGIDFPGAVVSAKAEKTGNGNDVQITWKKPVIGMNNGWFDDSKLTYSIVRQPDGVKVATDITATSFTDNTISQTKGYSYQITAKSQKGEGVVAETNIVVAGTALEVPYSSNFSDDEDFRLWTIIDGDGDGETWYRENNYAGTADWFMKYMSQSMLSPNAKNNDWFISAPIHLDANKYYSLSYAIRLMSSNGLFPCNYTITLGESNTIESQTQQLAVVDGEENMIVFENHSVAVHVDKTGDYCIGFQLRNRVPAQITNISIVEEQPIDAAISDLKGTSLPVKNSEQTYTAVVTNKGGMELKSYTVSIVDEEGNLLASEQYNKTLAPAAKEEVTIKWTPSAEGKMNICCKVETDDDAYQSNNTTDMFSVNVMPQGAWSDIKSGSNVTSELPVDIYTPFSASQTIYLAKELNANSGNKLSAVTFYYTTLTTAVDMEVPVRIYARNTDNNGMNNFFSNEGELVFDGKMKLTPSANKTEIAFDKPLEYTGGNVELTIASDLGRKAVGYMFYVTYDRNEHPGRTLMYSDTRKFDFTQLATRQDAVANVSFFFAGKEATGISSMQNAECRMQNVYNLQGQRVNADAKGIVIVNGKKYLNK